MPFDGEPKLSSESEKSNTPWWTKCLPSFPVRGRHRLQDDVDEPDMTVANSPRKKRRASSLLPNRRKPGPKVMAVEVKAEDMEASIAAAKAAFDAAIENEQDLDNYTKKHNDLLAQEDKNAWDREARPKLNSRVHEDILERKADAIIRAIREYERRKTFGNIPSEALPGPETLDMGGQFLTNKDRIEKKSLLYRIAYDVPKGALLHLHFNAELYPERLLKEARKMDNMYIRSIRPLTKKEDLDVTEVVFNVMDEDQVEKSVDIFSEDYNGVHWRSPDWKLKVWMKWRDFQKEFDARFHEDFPGPDYSDQPETPKIPEDTSCGGEVRVELNRTEKWLLSKMVLSPDEAYGPDQTVNGVWARFNQATRCFKGLLNYEKVYTWYIEQAIDRMIEEKIMYAELRPMLLDKSIPSNDGKRQITNAEQMKLIIAGVAAKKAKLAKKNELRKFPFGLKIIYCTPRSIPKAMMREEMKHCIDLKLQFPDLICGFDLVGAEDRPNHIGFYRTELLAFQKTCRNTFIDGEPLKIPFLFHAGETLLDTGGSSDPKNSNLYDAALLDSKRIGHGFALMKHPHLLEKFRRNPNKPGSGICVELCPISNELLHLCRNIKEHPFPELLAAGIPCTVNSDNPSLFSNSMQHEFYQIMVGAPTISLYSWKQLARWSIEYSCLNKKEQEKGQHYLDEDWKKFCSDVVDTFEKQLMKEKDGSLEIDEDKAEYVYRTMTGTNFGMGRPNNNDMSETAPTEELAIKEDA